MTMKLLTKNGRLKNNERKLLTRIMCETKKRNNNARVWAYSAMRNSPA